MRTHCALSVLGTQRSYLQQRPNLRPPPLDKSHIDSTDILGSGCQWRCHTAMSHRLYCVSVLIVQVTTVMLDVAKLESKQAHDVHAQASKISWEFSCSTLGLGLLHVPCAGSVYKCSCCDAQWHSTRSVLCKRLVCMQQTNEKKLMQGMSFPHPLTDLLRT